MAGRKKPAPPEEEGSPAWMNTYGDMVTLLLTFFVLLFSFSTIDAKKWEEVVQSMSGAPYVAIEALNPDEVIAEAMTGDTWEPGPSPTVSASANTEEQQLGAAELAIRFDELFKKIKTHISENGLDEMLKAEKEYDMILLRMTDSALFNSGKDEIRPDAQQLLDEICVIIDEYRDMIITIRVEGHTDNVPIHTSKFEDNWDLSTMRATSVVRYMQSIMTIEPEKLNPTGYGEYHPVDTNDTEEGKANNRRVDFVIQGIIEE